MTRWGGKEKESEAEETADDPVSARDCRIFGGPLCYGEAEAQEDGEEEDMKCMIARPDPSLS
jgi:hypothetical protein